MPSTSPSYSPSFSPSGSPSLSPSYSPSGSMSPSLSPSYSPSGSMSPSLSPSYSPSGSMSPSLSPSYSPSGSMSPSISPSYSPSYSPSKSPSYSPSKSPSYSPSLSPSTSSSGSPSRSISPSPIPLPGTAVQQVRVVNPWFLEQDADGRPAVGYLVYTLVAGSVSTPLTTYLDANLTVPNTNPIVLNTRGEALIFTDQAYIKLVYTAPGGDLTSPIWTLDFVASAPARDITNIGEASGSANNVYVVDTVPAYTSIPDGFSLIMMPDITSLDTFISDAFSGSGINDAVFTGPYVGTTTGSIFQVQIDGVGSPNTFKWRKDSGSWIETIQITGDPQVLEEGISVTFSEVVGHTLNDLWTQTVRTPAYLNLCGLGADIIYKNEGQALVALGAGDIVAGIPAHLDRSQSQSCWILLNPSLPVLSTLPRRIRRKEIVSDYTIRLTDAGNEISYTGSSDATITLLPCTEAADYVWDISNVSNYIVTIVVAGAPDVIILPEAVAGVTSLTLRPITRMMVRLVTNGANWHILAETTIPHGNVILDGTPWVCPDNVTQVLITASGGGQGGTSGGGGSGGGKGKGVIKFPAAVVPGTSYTNTIGAAGVAGNPPGNGGTTIFGVILSLPGGTVTSLTQDGEDSYFGLGGPAGNPGTDASGYGAGGGAALNPGNVGGKGSPGFIFLEW